MSPCRSNTANVSSCCRTEVRSVAFAGLAWMEYWSCSSLGSSMSPPSLGAAGDGCRHELFVQGQVSIDHAVERKLPCNRLAAAGAVRQRSGDPFGDLRDVTTDPPVDAVLDN